MDDLQKKIAEARKQRKDGKRVEVAPTMELEDLRTLVEQVTGIPEHDQYMVVTAMGPEGCQVEAKQMAACVLCAGPRSMCKKVFDELYTRGFNGEAFPFDLAIVRQNRWFTIPFEVGTKTHLQFHDEEVQMIFEQEAKDVDLVGGVERAHREGVKRYFAGFNQ